MLELGILGLKFSFLFHRIFYADANAVIYGWNPKWPVFKTILLVIMYIASVALSTPMNYWMSDECNGSVLAYYTFWRFCIQGLIGLDEKNIEFFCTVYCKTVQ